jgi:hypothetical protein
MHGVYLGQGEEAHNRVTRNTAVRKGPLLWAQPLLRAAETDSIAGPGRSEEIAGGEMHQFGRP